MNGHWIDAQIIISHVQGNVRRDNSIRIFRLFISATAEELKVSWLIGLISQ